MYLGVTEGRIAAEEVSQKDHNIAGVFREQKCQKHVIRHERFNHYSEEHDAVADCIGSLESRGKGRDEVGQHLH